MARVLALVGITLAAVILGPASAAHAAPLIDLTLLEGDAVVGRTVELQVRATDPQAPVTGMVVGFGRGSRVTG